MRGLGVLVVLVGVLLVVAAVIWGVVIAVRAVRAFGQRRDAERWAAAERSAMWEDRALTKASMVVVSVALVATRGDGTTKILAENVVESIEIGVPDWEVRVKSARDKAYGQAVELNAQLVGGGRP